MINVKYTGLTQIYHTSQANPSG